MLCSGGGEASCGREFQVRGLGNGDVSDLENRVLRVKTFHLKM